MAGNMTNVAQINILCTELSTSNVLINRSFSPTLTANGGVFATYDAGTVGGAAIPFPIGIVNAYNVYIRNLNVAGGASILFIVTFNGQNATSVILGPGDVFLYWTNTNPTGPSAGISITGLAVAAGSTGFFECFVGG